MAAHPSALAVPQEIEPVKAPCLFLCAGDDAVFKPKDRKLAEEVLKRNGVAAEFVDYPGTKHGFAVRGDEKNEVVRAARDDATRRTAEFFKKQLQ